MTPRGQGTPQPPPPGVVTVLLAELEGASRLQTEDPGALARVDQVVGQAVSRHDGTRIAELERLDRFVSWFPRASDAVSGALRLQRTCGAPGWTEGTEPRLRVALNSGVLALCDNALDGPAVDRCARLLDLTHGGQILLARATRDLAEDQPPEGATFVDLGTHRLRDLARAEHVYQLCHPDLPVEFPEPRSLDAMPNNLATQLTSFVGRRDEIAALREIVGETRLVTLTGTGGCGKTRLALHTAAELLDRYPDGAWSVDLAPIADPELVPSAVAAALAVREVPGQSLAQTLIDHVRHLRALILLDNCEHVIGACAELVHDLLQASVGTTILATSREPLGVVGEVAWRVPSLTLPDAQDLPAAGSASQSEAVRLFGERATQVRPTFQIDDDNASAVTAICVRLDGVPLAIELAAARTRLLTPAQITAGLDDRFRLLTGGSRMVLPRHRTLRASIDWSHDLLTQPERVLLRRLSVFAGGFDLDAVEHVCTGDGMEPRAVLDLLSGLVDRSLVQVDDVGPSARYRLLETIRQYAVERLAQSGEEAHVRAHHLDYFVALAERAAPELEGAGLIEWLPRLDAAHDDLRAAMDWSVRSGHAHKALRIVAASWIFWFVRGHLTEARQRAEAALAAAGIDPVVRAAALVGVGQIELYRGDYAAARTFAEEALALSRDAGHARLIGRALVNLGWVLAFTEPISAPPVLREAIERCRRDGDTFGLVDALNGMGLLNLFSGDVGEACRFLEEAESIARADGNRLWMQLILMLLGYALTYRGDFARAETASHEALALARDLGDAVIEDSALAALADIAMWRGQYAAAARLIDRVLGRADHVSRLVRAIALMRKGTVAYARGEHEAADATLDAALTLFREIGLATWIAWALRTKGDVARLRGDLAGASERLAEAIEVGSQAQGIGEALALEGAGRLARAQGAHGDAEDLHHAALRVLLDARAHLFLPETFESLAGLAALHESYEEAARLFGAAEAQRETIGSVRFPVEEQACLADLALARDGLPPEGFQHARDEGRAMTSTEAAAYVTRGRGERKRPSVGWASLTPTELDVVRLLAEGLTNPQIAQRLFVARSTVKTHLSHVFRKLGVVSRTELATEATRRGFTQTR